MPTTVGLCFVLYGGVGGGESIANKLNSTTNNHTTLIDDSESTGALFCVFIHGEREKKNKLTISSTGLNLFVYLC
jgi:hypothetical protein